MTDEMMDLHAILEKASSTDVLREMLAFGAKRLMELEIGAKTGAAFGEKSADRLAQRRYHDVPYGGEAAHLGGWTWIRFNRRT
jgi:hypothetical protein